MVFKLYFYCSELELRMCKVFLREIASVDGVFVGLKGGWGVDKILGCGRVSNPCRLPAFAEKGPGLKPSECGGPGQWAEAHF